MTDTSVQAFEDELIEDARAHGGQPSNGPLEGHPLLVMMSTGARTGEPRRAILTWSRDRHDYVVAGTAGGSPKDPAWLENVARDRHVTVEAEGRPPVAATATIVEGPERERLWNQHVLALPHFAPYPEQTGREIPMIRLTVEAGRSG